MSTFELTPEEMELFLTEAAEQVDTMEELLVDLEKGAEPDAVSAIFRAAHTLKGGAATAGMNQTARLTHALESLLDQIRSGQRDADPDTVDALLEAVDMLRTCLTVIEEHGTDAGVDVGPLSERLEALVAGVPAEDGPERASGEAPAAAEGAGTEAPSPAVDPSLAALAREAAAAGQRVLVVRVTVETGAAMPSIRLYQTLMVLDEAGRLVRTEPSREQIEDPASEHWHLEAVLVTAHSPDEVRAALGEVSYLERVEIEEPGVPAAGAAGAAGGADRALAPPDAGAAPPGASDAGADAGTDAPAPVAKTGGQAPSAAAPAPAPPAAGAAPEAGSAASAASRTAAGAANSGGAAHVADTVRVSVRVLDHLMNLVGELVIDRTRLARLGQVDMEKRELVEELNLVAGHLNRISTDLQDTIMSARMVPLDTLFRRFPRMARDLARKLGKQVRFVVSGEDTELDRSVIEHIGDPLVHLIRNAIDHGLEPPEERRAAGKDPEGTVRLVAYHQENHIYIEVSDDGRGISAERVKRSAVAKGLITEEEAQQLQGHEALDLLFLPGFTTSGQVTDVSGRGVGLDVVRRNIERVNGTVSVESTVGRGTVWTIRLPLTLAIVQSMMVRIHKTVFAVPLDTVDEIVLVDGRRVQQAGGWPMVPVRERVIPLVNPGDVWGAEFRAAWDDNDNNPVVVLQSASGPLALAVDELIGEQETVIKTIDGLGGEVPGVSGASILGDGSVALIFDVTGFAKEVRRIDQRHRRHDGRHGKSA